jgi:gamma-glutamylcysteine synthetase
VRTEGDFAPREGTRLLNIALQTLVSGVKSDFILFIYLFFISNFRRVLYVVCFILGDSPASEFYKPTFRNTLSVPSL